eukprot:jgi/Chlat1/6257/Chrsp44S05773
MAVQLLRHGAGGRWELGEEALAALEAARGPATVVAVCGRSRQGKSYVLNRLLGLDGKAGGFRVGSTHQACTRGLWLWPRGVKVRDHTVFVLDSEGIDAYDQTATTSVQIFSYAVLLSSLFVYNQARLMGGIDEAALDRLALVTEVARRVGAKAGAGDSSAPTLVWLLRDFYLELAANGRAVTPKQYLEEALTTVPGQGSDIVAKNQIRESICTLFPERECFALVRPVNEERDLQQLETVAQQCGWQTLTVFSQADKLRPQFREGMAALTKYVMSRAEPKRVHGSILTGPAIAGLARAFAQALNQGAVPTIATAWQSVAESECRRACDAGLEAYDAKFDKNVPPEVEALRDAHDAALEAAVGIFRTTALGDPATQHAFEQRLIQSATARFKDYKERVYAVAAAKTSDLATRLGDKVMQAVNNPQTTAEAICKLIESVIVDFQKNAAGPDKLERLAQFASKGAVPACMSWFQRRLAASTEELQRMSADMHSTRQAAERAAAEAAATQKDFQTRSDDTVAQLRKDLDHARSDLRERDSQLRATSTSAETARTTAENRVTEQRVRAERAEVQLATSHEQLSALRKEHTTASTRLKEVEESERRLRADCERLQRALQTAESTLSSRAGLDEQLARERQLRSAAEAKAAEAQQEVARLEQDSRQAQGQQQTLQGRVADYETKLTRTQAALTQAESSERLSAAQAATVGSQAAALLVEATTAKENLEKVQAEVERLRNENEQLKNDLEQAKGREEEREKKFNTRIQELRAPAELPTASTPPRAAEASFTPGKRRRSPYSDITVPQLKQELTDAGYGHEVLNLGKKATKKDLYALYERFIREDR